MSCRSAHNVAVNYRLPLPENHYVTLTFVLYRRPLAAAWNADTQLTHGSRG